MSAQSEIIDIVSTFFDSGKTKNLAPLRAIQLDDPRFSSYNDVPPLDLKDYATTIALEELRFVSISDYNYEIKNIKVSIFDNSAIATFLLKQTGMLVDNKAFTGHLFSMESRATFVFVKIPRWKIVHFHFSKISD